MEDFILNGQAHGGMAATLLQNNMDPGCLRPYFGSDGRQYISVTRNNKLQAVPVNNANTTLRKDEWKILDDAVLKIAKPRLRAFGDLRSAGLSFNIPNGMAKTVFEYERMSDITAATISMDGIRQSESDRPIFDLQSIPLPIIHKDFAYTARQLQVSRNGSTPLDTTTAEMAARRVAEEIEKLTLGVSDSYSFGGGTIYGYLNYPSRQTYVMRHPADTVWTPATTIQQLLAMRAQIATLNHLGPFFVYNSPDWDEYLDDDYSIAGGNNPNQTLRERIARIDGFDSPRTLDYLTGTTMLLVEKNQEVARAVVGMDVTTVQWESHGGMQVNFKVMAIMIPQLRADMNSQTGIMHGTATATGT